MEVTLILVKLKNTLCRIWKSFIKLQLKQNLTVVKYIELNSLMRSFILNATVYVHMHIYVLAIFSKYT